jgi:hypothetical protein
VLSALTRRPFRLAAHYRHRHAPRAWQENAIMIASRPIDIAGRFVGVAVSHHAGWRFRAVDPVVDDLDGATFASLGEAVRVAQLVAARTQDWAHGKARAA